MQPTVATAENPPTPAAPAFPFLEAAWFLALLGVLFFPVLRIMVWEWIEIEDMGHAFFVPVVAGYVVWKERDRILAQPVKPFWPAILLIFWAFVQMVLGYLGAEFFLSRTAFLLAIVGVIWTLAGTAVLRTLAFPLFILVFMVRIPTFLYQQLTFPLQLLASSLATDVLQLVGIPVLLQGNILELPGQRLQVIEACSGIRSLLSLTFLSLVYAYAFDRRVWMRTVLFAITIPLAIGANALRVTVTGILTEYDPKLAEGFFHTFEGWIVFMAAMGALLGAHRLICRFAGTASA